MRKTYIFDSTSRNRLVLGEDVFFFSNVTLEIMDQDYDLLFHGSDGMLLFSDELILSRNYDLQAGEIDLLEKDGWENTTEQARAEFKRMHNLFSKSLRMARRVMLYTGGPSMDYENNKDVYAEFLGIEKLIIYPDCVDRNCSAEVKEHFQRMIDCLNKDNPQDCLKTLQQNSRNVCLHQLERDLRLFLEACGIQPADRQAWGGRYTSGLPHLNLEGLKNCLMAKETASQKPEGNDAPGTEASLIEAWVNKGILLPREQSS